MGKDTIIAKDWENGHYTAWWKPADYGSYTMKILSENNFGASATETITINIVETTTDIEKLEIDRTYTKSI